MKTQTHNGKPVVIDRLVRVFVKTFLPWIALRKAQRQLRIAASIIRNECILANNEKHKTLSRWADECEHDGWTIYKPYDTPEYREWLNGKPNESNPSTP